ncbi:GtrA family protein [Aliivibrio fischeri]|uniref:GtrA family protein n=1 Tax=Aliivibrio fischeri TaxID=668 RepID=UPI0007C4DA16|nr:GtrA family protein [Aliivibrio fischeri]MCE7576092.1 GtrA family protein [Aliivibrio fischeri]MCE7588382.1 GtrA family protein [Aliivibrio fischeri]TGA71942.1 GtrA family protein [Aliivibrio fischeri]
MSKSLVKFALVGSVGFLVDSCIFMLFFNVLDVELVLARVIAFICAATTTWLGNRIFTFCSVNETSKDIWNEWKKAMLSAFISGVPNFATFILIVSLFGSRTPFVYIALCLGILSGMSCNYWLNSRWVFRYS